MEFQSADNLANSLDLDQAWKKSQVWYWSKLFDTLMIFMEVFLLKRKSAEDESYKITLHAKGEHLV